MQLFSRSKKKSNVAIPSQELVALYREALLSGVSLQHIEQKVAKMSARISVTSKFEHADATQRVKKIRRQLPFFVKLGAFSLPVGFITIGLFLVGNAAMPLLQYYVSAMPITTESELVSPLPNEQLLDISPTVVTQNNQGIAAAYQDENTNTEPKPIFIDAQLDYTNLANWFSASQVNALTVSADEVTEYTIDIPKLGIENAVVRIGGTDLDESLIQYPGTAQPGAAGAPVIFGHSVLRQFYNPSENNPRRYISIFSTIMTLKPGDEIYVTANGVKYKYLMKEKIEVKPEDVHILTQNYDAKQLKLVTCTPEGTYLRRGVITAQLATN